MKAVRHNTKNINDYFKLFHVYLQKLWKSLSVLDTLVLSTWDVGKDTSMLYTVDVLYLSNEEDTQP